MESPEHYLARFLYEILTAILDRPEDIEISHSRAPSGAYILTVFSPPGTASRPSEFGRLLGRGGLTAIALRRIMSITAARYDCHVLLDLVDGGKRPV